MTKEPQLAVSRQSFLTGRPTEMLRKALRDPGRNRWCAEQIEGLPPTTRILDIGCGHGNLINRIQTGFTHAFGVDMDAESLSVARASATNAQFIYQDGTSLPFSDDSFDVVILSDVLEHVPRSQQRDVLLEARRVIRTGGKLILTVPHTGVSASIDPMDVKRRFPRVYRAYSRLSGYVPTTSADIGHQHLSTPRLLSLLDGLFTVTSTRYCGLFEPLILWSQLVCDRILHLDPVVVYRVTRLRAWEGSLTYPRQLAYNVWITGAALDEQARNGMIASVAEVSRRETPENS